MRGLFGKFRLKFCTFIRCQRCQLVSSGRILLNLLLEGSALGRKFFLPSALPSLNKQEGKAGAPKGPHHLDLTPAGAGGRNRPLRGERGILRGGVMNTRASRTRTRLVLGIGALLLLAGLAGFFGIVSSAAPGAAPAPASALLQPTPTVGVPSPTPPVCQTPGGPTPTPGGTPIPVCTPTPPGPGTGDICVTVFHDANRNRLFDEGEEKLWGAWIWVDDQGPGGEYWYRTDGSEPYCFNNLVPDRYHVKEFNPPGYPNSTTPNSVHIDLESDQGMYVFFGDGPGHEPGQPWDLYLPIIYYNYWDGDR